MAKEIALNSLNCGFNNRLKEQIFDLKREQSLMKTVENHTNNRGI